MDLIYVYILHFPSYCHYVSVGNTMHRLDHQLPHKWPSDLSHASDAIAMEGNNGLTDCKCFIYEERDNQTDIRCVSDVRSRNCNYMTKNITMDKTSYIHK
eukprot:3608_1